jgi:hypothetical protein
VTLSQNILVRRTSLFRVQKTSIKETEYLMNFKYLGGLVSILVVLGSANAKAMAVAYSESLGIMSYNEALSSEQFLNYSFTSHLAAGSRYIRYNTTGGIRQFFIPEADALLHRWNNLDSQANLYFSAGYGAQSFQNQTSGAALGDFEADWESRKYYLDANVQDVLAADQRQFFSTRLRGGIAPYIADYNELSTWLIFQVETKPFLYDQPSLTPLVRLFYRNVLVEIGSSFEGDWQFNFMIHI